MARSAAHSFFEQHFFGTGTAATIRLCLLTLPLRPISDASCSILPTYVSENGWICIADIFVAGDILHWFAGIGECNSPDSHDISPTIPVSALISQFTPYYRWQCFHSGIIHSYWGPMPFDWEMWRYLGQAIWYRISLRVKNIILGGQIYLHTVGIRKYPSNHCCCTSSSLRYCMRLWDEEQFHGFSALLGDSSAAGMLRGGQRWNCRDENPEYRHE